MRNLVVLSVSALVIIGCGGGGGEPNEESLRKAAEDFGDAFVKGDAVRAYQHLANDYKDKCDLGEFTGALLLVRGFFGESFEKGEFRIQSVSIEEETGIVEGDIFLDGEPLNFDNEDEPDPWIWEEGKWRVTTQEADPCSFGSESPEATGGVSDGRRTPAGSPRSSPRPSPSPQTTFELGDTATTAAGNTLVIYTYEQPVQSGDEFRQPDPGMEFAAIDIEGCVSSTTTTSTSLSSSDFELQMPDNTRRTSEFGVREPELGFTEVGVGDCLRGFVSFQVPAGVRPQAIIFSGSNILKWTLP